MNLQAQALQWSSPDIMPGINLESYPPILVTDRNRTVHSFLSQWMGDPADQLKAVVYSQWTPEYGWSAPIDVITSPFKEARVTSAYLDQKDIIHLTYYGGDGTAGDIYYTSAPAAAAGDAKSWSSPILAGENAGDPEGAVILGGAQQDEFTIIYHGKANGYGLYQVTSKDGGNTWSTPVPIFLSDGDAPFVYSLHVIKSESGWIHAIWNTYTKGGQGRAIYYARAKIEDLQWSDPIPLATAEGLGTQTPNIIEYQNTLFALYNIPPKITMRRSIDNGVTWDDPTVLFPRHVGVNGSLALAIDGNQTMHLFFGQRIPGSGGVPDMHGMWHSVWLNGRWTEPDAVIKGPRIVDTEGTRSFDPYEAHAVVSQGNVILVTWRTDPGGVGDIKANGVWYSYAILNAPEMPVATSQVVDTPVSVAPTISPPTPTVQVTATIPVLVDKARPSGNPLRWLIIVVMLLGFLWMFYMILTRR